MESTDAAAPTPRQAERVTRIEEPLEADLREIETDPALRVIEEGLPAAAPERSWLHRHSKGLSAAFGLIVTAALVIGLYGKRDEFSEALSSASAGILLGAVALQVVWLIARSEAWYVCVEAAGGRCGRRPLYRAAAVGYLGNLLNATFGLAVRITELRRTGPRPTPRAPGPWSPAELPIVVIEIALAAICSFTLVGPLGHPLVGATDRAGDRRRLRRRAEPARAPQARGDLVGDRGACAGSATATGSSR